MAKDYGKRKEKQAFEREIRKTLSLSLSRSPSHSPPPPLSLSHSLSLSLSVSGALGTGHAFSEGHLLFPLLHSSSATKGFVSLFSFLFLV